MRIEGENFRVGVSVKDGVVIEADRPVSYMKGWPLARVLALAARWHWRVGLSADEEAQVERG
jgi:hypothetical protein